MDAPRIVDLSVSVDPASWEPEPVHRRVVDHRKGGDLLGSALIHSRRTTAGKAYEWLRHRLGLGVTHRNFPDGKGLSLMHYTLTTHTGTHMDAPYHYGDITDAGAPARRICEVPLEWCFGDGVVLDVCAPSRRGPVTKDEVVGALERTAYALKPFDIVLLRTGGDCHVGTPAYFSEFRGVTREATAWLVEQGIKVIGIDSFGFDAPFVQMLKAYQQTGNQRDLWPAHMYGRHAEYCQLERLASLGAIGKPHGFKVACFPIKLSRADAAWCRVVAIG